MSTETISAVYRAAGEAVLASQIFEFSFVLAAKLALKQADATTIEDVIPISLGRDFKNPVKNLLNELSAAGKVGADLEARITAWLVKRHRVVHREFIESSGWHFDNAEWTTSFIDLCTEVAGEGKELVAILIPLLLQWLEKFPETAALSQEHLSALETMARPK
jgi:hypothetical protein